MSSGDSSLGVKVELIFQIIQRHFTDQYKAADPPAELNAVVEDLLNQLTAKFSEVSSDMMSKSNIESSPACENTNISSG